jgi:hypothetical protein
MTDRIVVLQNDDPLSFVADACAALGDAVNAPHTWRSNDPELVAVYAAMVRAYACLVRPPDEDDVRRRIIDHVIERLNQAERGDIVTPVSDIADRLHGLLDSEPALH